MRLFHLLSLFFPVVLSAQLHISPSETGDAYVYVNEEVLFVERGIHLDKNSTGLTEASMYLRDEAQLMQGEKPSNLNSGDGWISVFQEGTSNAYDYNYWSLPVTDNIDPDRNFGASIFEPLDLTQSRETTVTGNYNGLAAPLSISRRWIYKFSGTAYDDWEYVGDNFDVAPGEGFTMKGVNGTNFTSINDVHVNPGNQQRYDFRGKPNDGDIHININKDKTVLVGNPYPSAIHLKSFLLDNPSSTGIAYFWDSRENGDSHHLMDYEGGYGIYSPGANTYAPAVFKKYNDEGEEVDFSEYTGYNYAREYTPIAQAFMLLGETHGQVSFKNSHRFFQKENAEDSQFRQQRPKVSLEEEIPVLRFNVEIDELYIRQLLLAFRKDASAGPDWAMDAENIDQIASDASWLINNKNYVINVQPYREDLKIPVDLKLNAQSEVKFNIILPDNFKPNRIFIFDAEEDSFYDITRASLALNLEKEHYQGRFYLCFKDTDTKPEEENLTELQPVKEGLLRDIQVVQNNAEDLLEMQIPDHLVLKQLSLYDINGSLIFQKTPNPATKDLQYSTTNLKDAVYILKLRTNENLIINKKITVK